ncbi:MAG TPA: tetratricopeptide repeat protein, partial [Burkholderiales bacterium]|nr:tetratricopeptide repeat protein [Burkholderiales bacterium]
FQAQARLDEAIASYRRALDLKPDYAEAHNNLGSALQAQGKLDEAIASYRCAMMFNPESVEVHNNLGCALQESGELEQALDCYDRALQIKPGSAETHYNRAGVFQAQARLDEAIASYRRALDLKPDYAEAHNNLGNAFKDQGRIEEAAASYQRALACKTDAQTMCNLGILYSKTEQYALAETWYRRALEADALSVVAHRNLSAILVNDGRTAEARMHMDAAYRRQCWFSTVSATARRTVLILLGVEKGNVPVAHLFPPENNNTIEWMVEYAGAGQHPELPAYDVVFNAVGEPDMTGNTSAPIAAFIENSMRPLLNHPAAIARTARHLMPALFNEIDGVIVPPVWRIAPGDACLAGLPFPVLGRPAGSHGGEQMKLLDTAAALEQWLAARQDEIVYLSAYYDYRSADGYFRKYRTIFIDGEVFPYHLAISPHWMVHYATSEMQDAAWKLEEERQFLENPERVLGARAMAAVAAIGRNLKLDYAGADFTLLPDGRVLLFEANATMLVHPEKEQSSLSFKNPYVQRIFQAFEDLLARKTALSGLNRGSGGCPSSPGPSAAAR